VEFTALLHDVGKIRVPKEIINKRGTLDPDEWEIVRQHTIEGERMLKRVGGTLSRVGRFVRSSHEHFDGQGYPDGLAGTAIPTPSRIVAVCDAFNAMTTDRPYRPAMTRTEALEELRRCAGTQFDPTVVEAMEHLMAGEFSSLTSRRPALAARGHRARRRDPRTMPGWSLPSGLATRSSNGCRTMDQEHSAV
jgi:HD-GYP domain-containing protein (c-di-GMP phosphodiesterase class II)